MSLFVLYGIEYQPETTGVDGGGGRCCRSCSSHHASCCSHSHLWRSRSGISRRPTNSSTTASIAASQTTSFTSSHGRCSACSRNQAVTLPDHSASTRTCRLAEVRPLA